MPPHDHRRTGFRNGFSSSLCGLFENPRRRSDCCALVCCGLLLSDRNRYVLTQERPPPWWKRLGRNVGIPIGVFVTLVLLKVAFETDETARTWGLLSLVTVILVITFLCQWAKKKRVELRKAILSKMHGDSDGQTDENSLSLRTVSNRRLVENHLRSHAEARRAHATCGCFRDDAIYELVDDDEGDDPEDSEVPKDLCHCLWRTLASLCCGWCCTCWCICCGMCAVGQEDRELQQLMSKQDFQVDYITFQPYLEYFGKLVELRQKQVMSFWQHLHPSNLSQLSKLLLRMFFVLIGVLALIALSNIDKHFTLLNLFVLLATFFQAFFILHFVHWRWNRFDLSLDAVIKYFASGFVLCTSIALIYEMLLSLTISLITYILLAVSLMVEGFDPEDVPEDPDDASEYAKHFLKENVVLLVLSVLLNAFVIAALTEELAKYFSFWMVEHPDFMDPDDLVEDSNDVSDELALITASTGIVVQEEPPAKSTPLPSQRTFASLGHGTTAAMVATALGFACCENLLYIFVYTPPCLVNEMFVLAIRSLFPLHPLAAAIQSIGVCQRDLEGNSSVQLGRIIFPAVLLHGSFDFVLMVWALLASLYGHNEQERVDESDPAEGCSTLSWDDIRGQLPAMLLSFVIELLGVLYYVVKARSQHRRLQELDRGLQEHGDGLLLV